VLVDHVCAGLLLDFVDGGADGHLAAAQHQRDFACVGLCGE
jgi:hypothetical protein